MYVMSLWVTDYMVSLVTILLAQKDSYGQYLILIAMLMKRHT